MQHPKVSTDISLTTIAFLKWAGPGQIGSRTVATICDINLEEVGDREEKS